ncbi:MAG: hypothetical protein AB8H79_01005, partial [Myxococcota bacterium]
KMRVITMLFLLSVTTGCSPKTGVRIPAEVGDIDGSTLSFATVTTFEGSPTSNGMPVYNVVVAVSDRPDLCDFTGPQGAVDTSIDARFAQIGVEATSIDKGRYVATTKGGPGLVDGPEDIAMGAFMYHRQGGETLIHAHTGTSPRASMTIDELNDNNVPSTGSFSYLLVKGRGTARPPNFDANGDGEPDYRKLDALVEGTFVDAEWCRS